MSGAGIDRGRERESERERERKEGSSNPLALEREREASQEAMPKKERDREDRGHLGRPSSTEGLLWHTQNPELLTCYADRAAWFRWFSSKPELTVPLGTCFACSCKDKEVKTHQGKLDKLEERYVKARKSQDLVYFSCCGWLHLSKYLTQRVPTVCHKDICKTHRMLDTSAP